MDFDLGANIFNLNGHDFGGWSEDGDALAFPTVDIANIKRGATGKQVATSTGDKGGPVIGKFLPTSKSVKFMQNIITTIQNGAVIKWNGFYKDPINQIYVTLTNGTLQNVPLGPTIGKGETANMIYTWEFELVVPDYMASTL